MEISKAFISVHARRIGNMELGDLARRKKEDLSASPGTYYISKEFDIIWRPASNQKTDFPHSLGISYWFNIFLFTYCQILD